MQGDFSRLTFDPTKQYSGVRMQQGRVQLDADWNEQMDILMHRLETEVADFIGPSGVPADLHGGSSFQVTVTDNGLQVAPGRIYLAGKLFENASSQTIPADQLPQDDGEYIAYLDAWQSTVSALEDPAIREVALGGADTTVRVKNVWRVRFAPSAAGAPVAPAGMVRTTGKLRAHHDGVSTLGNQLYRVEIHTGGGAGVATYKWSRENGSVATTVESMPSPTQVVVSNAGRDNRLGFEAGQWVELLTLGQAQWGEAGRLARLEQVEGRLLTLAQMEPAHEPAAAFAIVRRWEGMGTIPADGKALPLESAISITFQPNGETDKAVVYSPGDYWLLPTRALTGQLEWPSDADGFQPPHGVRHYYAPLARLRQRKGNDNWRGTILADLRITFKPQDKGFVSKTGDTMTGPLIIEGNYASVANERLRMTRGIVDIDGTIQQGQGYTVSTDQQNLKDATDRHTKAMENMKIIITQAIDKAKAAADQAESARANAQYTADLYPGTFAQNAANQAMDALTAARQVQIQAQAWPNPGQLDAARQSAQQAAQLASKAQENATIVRSVPGLSPKAAHSAQQAAQLAQAAQANAQECDKALEQAQKLKTNLDDAQKLLDAASVAIGRYTITFTPTFADLPTVVVTPMRTGDDSGFTIAVVGNLSSAKVEICCGGIDGKPKDSMFAFTAVGPRK